MNETADPRSPSGSPGAATTDATKCALCGGPFSAGTLRHYNSLGGGYYCYRCINAAPVAGGSPGAETPPISTVAHAFDSRLCVHCGKRRSAHDNYMSDQCPQGDGVFTTAPPPSVSHPTAEGAAKDLADVRPDDSDEIFKALADLATTLRQQLDDAILTARYQSDVARQADEAREKAEQERDAVIVTAADTIFTTTQTWIEKLAAAQAENAGLRADAARLSRLEELGDFWVVEPRLSEDAWEIRVGNETIGYGADLRDAIDGATPTPPQERKARRRDYTNAVTHSSYSFWLSREHAERLAAEQAVSGTESWNEWKPVPNTEAAYFALKQRVIDEQGATRAASAQERP